MELLDELRQFVKEFEKEEERVCGIKAANLYKEHKKHIIEIIKGEAKRGYGSYNLSNYHPFKSQSLKTLSILASMFTNEYKLKRPILAGYVITSLYWYEL